VSAFDSTPLTFFGRCLTAQHIKIVCNPSSMFLAAEETPSHILGPCSYNATHAAAEGLPMCLGDHALEMDA
jgi:hypothetical protein